MTVCFSLSIITDTDVNRKRSEVKEQGVAETPGAVFDGTDTAIFLSSYANINWVTFWGNCVGIVSVGMSCIAVCMFISSQTESQVISALGGLAMMLMIMSLNSLGQMIDFVPLKQILFSISFYSRYYNMTMGIFKVSDVFFFLSFSGVFYFLTIRVLEKRRWN